MTPKNKKPRILVVDSEKSALDLIKSILITEGYGIETASSGKEAIGLVTENSPDLVILNVLLSDESGIEICGKIKARRKDSFLPVILVTPAMVTAIPELRSAADDYITQPLDELKLKVRAQNMLRLKEAHDKLLNYIQIEKDLLEEMAKKNEMLTDANSLKDIFLAVASHDLRTPLSVVQLNCEHMLYGKEAATLTEDQLAAIRRIQSSAFYMTSIISDLLNSRLELNAIPIYFERSGLAPIIRECVGNHSTVASESGIELAVRVSEDLPLLWLDPVRIREVFNNLISNALTFTPKGGRVTVSAKHESGRVIVDVEDSGRGILQEDIPKLFMPYKRLVERVGQKGYGLGLYIVKEIVSRHGGEIQVTSEPAKGSCFRVILKVEEQSPNDKAPRPAKSQGQSPIALFGEIAIEKGYVNSKDVLECLNIQQKEALTGKKRMIGEILLEKKLITMPQIIGILQELARRKEG